MTLVQKSLARHSVRFALSIAVLIPLATHAASFADIVTKQVVPLGNKVVALFYALSFLFFLVGMARFFFSHSPEGREKGKLFALYGIGALVVLFAVWGFVRVLLEVLNGLNT